jgi:hypothetical protein
MKLLLIHIFLIITNGILLHNRLEKSLNYYDINILSSEIALYRYKGYDERYNESVTESSSILLDIIKNIEKLKKIQYLESIQHSPDEIKIQTVKDFSEECDIRPVSISSGDLFKNWRLDKEFDS